MRSNAGGQVSAVAVIYRARNVSRSYGAKGWTAGVSVAVIQLRHARDTVRRQAKRQVGALPWPRLPRLLHKRPDLLSGTPRAHELDRWIFVFMAVWFIAIVLAGFVPDC